MSKWRIHPKTPRANHTIWAGPEHQVGILPSAESDRHRARREALGHRLAALLGEENVTWNKRRYCYEAELSEEQVNEIKLWDFVSGLKPI